MKLKEDLVKRLREGYCTVEYDGHSLKKLEHIIGYELNGLCKYYWGSGRMFNSCSIAIDQMPKPIIPLADFFESDMGELEGFPEEIINAMLDEQERQGNNRDIEVFKNKRRAHKDDDGFGWRGSIEGYDFWDSIVYGRNFQTYFDKYPKEEVVQFNPYKPRTAEERDKLVEDLQAMTFEPTLEEVVKVLEDNHFMEREVNQAIDVVVKHLKNVNKG